MTYQPQNTLEASLHKLTHTGNLATNDYFTVTSDVSGITGESISGVSVTLPPGCYAIYASIGCDRAGGFDDLLFYQIELDGSLIGSKGAADCFDAGTNPDTVYLCVDQAVATFEVQKSVTLKIKCTSCTASTWTQNTDYSYLLIQRAA